MSFTTLYMAMKKDLEVTGVFHMIESLVIDKYCIPLCVSMSLFYVWSNELINFFFPRPLHFFGKL